jgi:hypothetical protein
VRAYVAIDSSDESSGAKREGNIFEWCHPVIGRVGNSKVKDLL